MQKKNENNDEIPKNSYINPVPNKRLSQLTGQKQSNQNLNQPNKFEKKQEIEQVDAENKYYFRLQKLLDNQNSKGNSNVSSSNNTANVNTFNQEIQSKNCSQESNLSSNLKKFNKNLNKAISFKNLSNNNTEIFNTIDSTNSKLEQSQNLRKNAQQNLKDILNGKNKGTSHPQKDIQIKQFKKMIDSSDNTLKNLHLHKQNIEDSDEISDKKRQMTHSNNNINVNAYSSNNLSNNYNSNHESSNQDKSSGRFMNKNDIIQLEEFVNEKMNFCLLKQQKYQKDLLNDRENDVEILKIMRDFYYFENSQSTLDFKNRFNIGQVIGEGAYAQVREAYDNLHRKKVAIKIYKKERLREGQRLRGIRREVAILVLLKKIEKVGAILDLVETRNHINIIMEYCDGKDLYQNMKGRYHRRLDESECKIVFGQLIQALGQIHSVGVSHRDIKLENILVSIPKPPQQNSPKEELMGIKSKVIDFGFSTCQLKQQKNRIFCGTPSYMAPEIVRKVYYEGFQADIWASGVVLYAILSGDFPFKGQTDRELYTKIQNVQLEYPDNISGKAKDLLMKIFQADPANRPTCKQVLNDPWLKDVFQQDIPIKGNSNNSFANRYQNNVNKLRNQQDQHDQFKEFIKKVGNKIPPYQNKNNNGQHDKQKTQINQHIKNI